MVGRISAILRISALVTGCVCGSALAQIRIINGVVVNGSDDTPKSPGFSVRKEPQAIVDALDDFDRYCGKEAWEKAFASLAIASDANPTGLIPAKDGFYLPTRLRVRQALCALIPAGRAAYRLFNDAKAKQALDAIGPAVNAGQISALRKIADQYFISSVGDQANDRLGDALFESGDFAAAAACWGAILTDYPDSSMSPLRLMTKRGIALARAGDEPAFAQVLASVRDRYAGQIVHLGGKDVIATDYLAAIAPARAAAPSEPAVTSLELPSEPTPAWQFPLMDDATRQQIEQQLNNIGWGAMAQGVIGGVAPIDFDARRIYINFMSACMALDLRTGKLLWRSDKISVDPQRVQQQVMQGQDFTGDAVAAAPDPVLGDRVLFVRRNPQSNVYNEPKQLICLAGDTGKMLWSSENSGFLSAVLSTKWDFSGTPLVVGQTAYVVAHAQQQQDATLLAISIKDGRQLWTMELGTTTGTPNFRGMITSPEAMLLMRGSKLYVLTNNGALLAVDLPSHTLDWAFTYEPTGSSYDPRFGFNPSMMAMITHSPGAMRIIGSTMLLKEADNPAMYAVDLNGPSLLWRRPMDASAAIVHADEHGALLLGEDLSYMDWGSRQLQWSAHLPGLGSAVRPVLSPGHIDLFLPRGIFDMDTGDGDTLRIFRGYEHDSSGGTLWRSGDRLIAVSNRSITAYAVSTGATR